MTDAKVLSRLKKVCCDHGEKYGNSFASTERREDRLSFSRIACARLAIRSAKLSFDGNENELSVEALVRDRFEGGSDEPSDRTRVACVGMTTSLKGRFGRGMVSTAPGVRLSSSL